MTELDTRPELKESVDILARLTAENGRLLMDLIRVQAQAAHATVSTRLHEETHRTKMRKVGTYVDTRLPMVKSVAHPPRCFPSIRLPVVPIGSGWRPARIIKRGFPRGARPGTVPCDPSLHGRLSWGAALLAFSLLLAGAGCAHKELLAPCSDYKAAAYTAGAHPSTIPCDDAHCRCTARPG